MKTQVSPFTLFACSKSFVALVIKSMILIMLIPAALMISCDSGTGSDSTNSTHESQGPENPSFEDAGSYDWTSAGWTYDSCGVTNPGYRTLFRTDELDDTAAFPTSGIYYLAMDTTYCSEWGGPSISLYQDEVEFDRSAQIKFDYSFEGECGDRSGCIITVSMLFTSEGTSTLWSKDFTTSEMVFDETVDLPVLNGAGRFTIVMDTAYGTRTCPGAPCQPAENPVFIFRLDNIRTL